MGTAGVAVQHVDLANAEALRACAAGFRPTHIVHLGAMTSVAECHARPAAAEEINVRAVRVLAEVADGLGARLLFSSTDMVFDGSRPPYRETDPPQPLSHYGQTKVAAERVLAGHERALVVRIPLLYGLPCAPRETTFVQQLAALRSGAPVRLFTDEYRTPVWLADAAGAVLGLARSELTGVIHLTGPERLSRYELVARCAALLGITEPNLVPVSRRDVGAAEPRPADLSLDGRRLERLFPQLAPGPLRAAALAPA
jgi:dTDP-4-dehydrorhamnose reductase